MVVGILMADRGYLCSGIVFEDRVHRVSYLRKGSLLGIPLTISEKMEVQSLLDTFEQTLAIHPNSQSLAELRALHFAVFFQELSKCLS